MNEQEGVTLQEAARLLNKSDKQLRRDIKAGKIKAELIDGRYFIAVQEVSRLLAKKRGDKREDTTLPYRLDVLEQRLKAIERALTDLAAQLAQVQRTRQDAQQTPRNLQTTKDTTHPQEGTPAPQENVYFSMSTGRGKLPEGLIGWREFARMHGIPETTVQAAEEEGRLPVVIGVWKVGRAKVRKALDATGQRRFYELFCGHERFVECEECPHSTN